MQVSLTQNSLDEYLSIVKSIKFLIQPSCSKFIKGSVNSTKYPPFNLTS